MARMAIVDGVQDLVQIRELSTRLGVGAHALRAWERRYALLQPSRGANGYRLYSRADERRVREFMRLRGAGLAAGAAAGRVLAAERSVVADPADTMDSTAAQGFSAQLMHHVEDRNELLLHRTLDESFDRLGVEATLVEVLVPLLREIGDCWSDGTLSIAHEHLAVQAIRGRLAPFTLAWAGGTGPTAVLACPPGEQHDLALLVFGILAHRRGWRIRYLGVDTPLVEMARAADDGEGCVVVSVTAAPVAPDEAGVRALRETGWPVYVAGPGSDAGLAVALGAQHLVGDIRQTVEQLTTDLTRARHASH